ncbi:MAG: alanine racemase, partial [Terriglobia bacterium]
MHYSELPTPALTIDLKTLDRNLDRMANYCKKYGLGLRPHTKTHKIPEIARRQIERGAVGLTVAKTGEAEVMAGANLDNILVAFPVFGREAAHRLAKLAIDRHILISLDDELTALALSKALEEQGVETSLGVLVEFDAGFGRCGIPPGPALVELARKIEKMPRLRFRGLMSFFGNVWGAEEDRTKGVRQAAERLEMSLEAFRAARMPVEIVSGGSTPSAGSAHQIPGLTEIRPGTYAFNDLNTL